MSFNLSGIEEELIPWTVSYETSSCIDDLSLICENGRKVFVQVKTYVSLSEKPESPFVKTVLQFVEEFIKTPTGRDHLLLVTQSSSSSKIIGDLRKLLFAVRLNSQAFDNNPLTKSETETLNTFRKVFDRSYEALTETKPDKILFQQFAKRCIVAVIDIESGHPFEGACLMLLKSRGFHQPHLIFSLLVTNSLTYSAQRLSIDAAMLDSILDRYRRETATIPTIDLLNTLLKEDEKLGGGDYSVAREVLFIQSLFDSADYMIVELHRFRDDCQIKSVFYEDKVRIPSGDEWKVLRRFATFAGLERYLKEHDELFKDKKIPLISANGTDNLDTTPCAQLHRAHLADLIKSNHQPRNCLHCGRVTSGPSAHIVEIEDRDTIAAVGLVHEGCIRPIDRIIGLAQIPSSERDELDGFDFRLWVRLLMNGQGMLNNLRASPQMGNKGIPCIGWSSDVEYDAEYSYCVKFVHVDSSVTYAKNRGKVQRMNKQVAEEYVAELNNELVKASERKDPLCHTSVKQTYGQYSVLLTIKGAEEDALEIQKAEVVKYSKLVAQSFDNDFSYYAPLCFLRGAEEEEIVNLGNVVPLISDPLKLKALLANWSTVGVTFDGIELKIIKSDQDFDGYLRKFFADKMSPIIDPEFDRNRNLVKGYPIEDLNRMIAERTANGIPREG